MRVEVCFFWKNKNEHDRAPRRSPLESSSRVQDDGMGPPHPTQNFVLRAAAAAASVQVPAGDRLNLQVPLYKVAGESRGWISTPLAAGATGTLRHQRLQMRRRSRFRGTLHCRGGRLHLYISEGPSVRSASQHGPGGGVEGGEGKHGDRCSARPRVRR